MKWKYYPLRDDAKAKKQILENVSIGAHEHTLTKKLLARFSEATGPIVAIAFDSLDLDKLADYSYATYDGGKQWSEAARGINIPMSDCPIGGLVHFVQEFLRTSKDAVVLCENWADTRTDYLTNWRPRESHVLFFGEEVYHILTSANDTWEAIETAIRESTGQWATSVCSFVKDIPRGVISSESFFDAVVANTAHIFTPAFDGEGYLIWSPGQDRDRRDQRAC